MQLTLLQSSILLTSHGEYATKPLGLPSLRFYSPFELLCLDAKLVGVFFKLLETFFPLCDEDEGVSDHARRTGKTSIPHHLAFLNHTEKTSLKVAEFRLERVSRLDVVQGPGSQCLICHHLAR
jgi:hypothetical protein